MIKNVLIFVVAVLIGVGAMYAYNDVLDAGGETKVTINSIKKISELATIEYTMSVIKEQTKKKEFLEWKDARFLVLVTGKLREA